MEYDIYGNPINAATNPLMMANDYGVNNSNFAAIPANNSWLSSIGNSLSNSWGEFSKMPWKSTPSTYDSKTGVFTQGTPGKYDSMMGFGKDVFGLLGAGANIMGGMKYGKYVDTQRKALNQAILHNSNAAYEGLASAGAGKALKAGYATNAKDAYDWGDKYAQDRMKKWG